MYRWAFIIFAAMASAVIATASTVADAKPGHETVAVLQDPAAPWIVRHASDELASYLGKMRPESKISLVSTLKDASGTVFVVCSAKDGRILSGIAKSTGWNPSRKVTSGEEGFAIKSLRMDGHPLVAIVGSDGKGALNGVYHYLEHVCGMGLFPDGEQIPRLSKLPVENLDIVEVPRFRYRGNLPLTWGVGLRDYFCRMWSLEDWQRHILKTSSPPISRLTKRGHK